MESPQNQFLPERSARISWSLYQILFVLGVFQSTSIGSEKTLQAVKNISVHIVVDSSQCIIIGMCITKTIRVALFVARHLFFTMTSSTTQTFAVVTKAVTILSVCPSSLRLRSHPRLIFSASLTSKECAIPCIWF